MIEALLKNAVKHQTAREYDSARMLFNKCILLDSSNHLPYFLLGNLEKDLGNFYQAISYIENSLEYNNRYINSYLCLCSIYLEIKNHKYAITVLQKGILINQTSIDLRLKLSEVYVAIGLFKKASIIFYEIIELDSKNFYSYYRLVQIDHKVLDKNLKNTLKENFKNNQLADYQKIYINLLLAKYESKIDRSSKELQYLLEAHKLHYESNRSFFSNNNQFIFDKLKNIQTYFDKNKDLTFSNQLRNSMKPIFIFGLPRSGSTLIEKMIIKDNPKYVSGEETKLFNLIADTIFFNKCDNNINQALEKIFISYIDKFKSSENIFFTDKSLNNFFFLGWIKRLFPNAKFVHCIRNPYIVTSSILRHNLSNLTWAHKLEDIVKYIDLYQEVISGWKRFEIDYYDIHYDNLVNNFEFETKKLFKYCEIEWNNDLVNFNKNNNYISQTASNIKVRSSFSINEDEKYFSLAKHISHQINRPNWYKIN